VRPDCGARPMSTENALHDYLTNPGSFLITGSASHRFATAWREAVKNAGLGLQFYQPRLAGRHNLPLFVALDRPDHVAARLRRLLASGWRGVLIQVTGPTSGLIVDGPDRGMTINLAPPDQPQKATEAGVTAPAPRTRPEPHRAPGARPGSGIVRSGALPPTLADTWPPAFLTGSARP